jgi:hypothetical protein
VQAGEARDRGSPDNMETLLELSENSSFDIISAIRRLILTYGSKESLPKPHLLRFARCSQLTDLKVTLPYCARRDHVDTIELLHSQLTVVGPQLSSLAHFSLGSHECTLRGLLDVLACMPKIGTLSLVGRGMHPVESSGRTPPFPHLRHFHANIATGAGHLFDHFLSLPTVPLLRSLGLIEIMEPEAYTAITQYLEHAGAALQSLQITLWDRALGMPLLLSRVRRSQSLISESCGKQVLQRCTDLRRLSITVWGLVAPTFVIDVLGTATSNNLLSIRINLGSNNGFSSAEDLDQALAHPRFCALRSISLVGIGPYEYQSLFTPEIRARMPLASARGIFE